MTRSTVLAILGLGCLLVATVQHLRSALEEREHPLPAQIVENGGNGAPMAEIGSRSTIRHASFDSDEDADVFFADSTRLAARRSTRSTEGDCGEMHAVRDPISDRNARLTQATDDDRSLPSIPRRRRPEQHLSGNDLVEAQSDRISARELRHEIQQARQLDDWYVEPNAITAEMAARRHRIHQVMAFYYQKPLNSNEHSPWSMMHHMLGWGVDGYIEVGGPGGRRASVIGWLCANGTCEGEQLMTLFNGRPSARMGNGLQGHEGQFLSLLAQARVAEDQELHIDGKYFTVADLIETEKATCRSRTELTFKLMGLVHYLHTDSTWVDDMGREWSFPKLMEEEIRAPINGVTCGGTHRLMALAYAARRRRRDGYALDGIWEQSRRHVAQYQQLAFKLQNRDGSMSSDFFRKAGAWGDPDRKLKTTGHTLEWLIFSLPHEQLQDPRLTRAIDYMSNLMIQNRHFRWGKGPLGHAIRALSLYEERVFGTRPGHRNYDMASAPGMENGPHPERRLPYR